MHKLLLLEDDISLIDGLTYGLERQGFDIVVARTIKEAEKLVEGSTGFDLLLFDVTLPDGNGFTLCERLRRSGSQVPIIFLTASDEETSVIRGLVRNPVIAVPTSVGYGASLGGLSALLTMINSCANGVATVNIDNGYGAGYLATQINRLAENGRQSQA